MIRSLYAGPIALAALMLPAAALAAPGASTAAPAAQLSMAQPVQSAVTTAPFGTALDETTMSKTTAREDTSMVAQSQQTSSVSNNTINGNSATGDINITDNAFQNATGMVLINANSGNNVSMNGSMNVNIIMTGPSPQH